MTDIQPSPNTVVAALPAVAAAAVAVGVSLLFPLAGPLLIALVIGAAVANSRLAESSVISEHAKATKLLLRLGIVMLGLKLPIGDIASFGLRGLAVVVVTVAATFALTVYIGDRLRLDRSFVTLLASGFSICGAAAIAAVGDAVRAKEKDVALAVALVTVYGSAMIGLVPWLANLLNLTDQQAAIWAGASIHEVAQVAAAASIIGSGALAVAMTIKLGRVLLLAPVYMVASRSSSTDSTGTVSLIPSFVVGFGIAAAIRTSGIIGADVLQVTDVLTTFLLAAGMFGLGLGIRAKQLWQIPPQALALATISTLVAAGTSLALVITLS